MPLNVREYHNKEMLLFPPAIGDYLPKDHLAHIVDEAVEELDMAPFYKKVPSVGNPSYHPALMIKIWFYGYATKVYSSRKIEEKNTTDVAFIFLSGMQKPDFRTISDFRKNNIKELKDIFIGILHICRKLGMVDLGDISIDSKVMKANASASNTYDEEKLTAEQQKIEKAIEEYLSKANQMDSDEDARYGAAKRGHELPEHIRDKEERVKKMRRAAEELRHAREKLMKSEHNRINLTDTDAQFQKGKHIIQGYRAQVAVDSKEQIIITNDVSEKQNDCPQLIPMIDKVLENVRVIAPDTFGKDGPQTNKINITADAGYSSGSNLAELKKKKYKDTIEPYIPSTNDDTKERGKGYDKESPFHRSKFIYDAPQNRFICPAGKVLRYVGQYDSHGVLNSIYENTCDCVNCQHYGICTNSKTGRRIVISEYQPLVDMMRNKLNTSEGKAVYAKRKITAEPAIGNLSHNMGFKEFLLRGLHKVRGEFSLMCAAHNILKIAKRARYLAKGLKEALAMPDNELVMNTS